MIYKLPVRLEDGQRVWNRLWMPQQLFPSDSACKSLWHTTVFPPNHTLSPRISLFETLQTISDICFFPVISDDFQVIFLIHIERQLIAIRNRIFLFRSATSFFHCTQGKRYQYNGKTFYNFFGQNLFKFFTSVI